MTSHIILLFLTKISKEIRLPSDISEKMQVNSGKVKKTEVNICYLFSKLYFRANNNIQQCLVA